MVSVLMLPWLAHGHISPFLELSKRFSDRNIQIHYCSTAANLNSIKRDLQDTKYLASIHLVELPLPITELFPPHYYTTKNLPPPLMTALKTTFDSSARNFSDILKLLDPDLVVYDFIQPWAPEIALSLDIPAIEFLCTSATMSAYSRHSMKSTEPFPFPKIYLHEHEMPSFARLLETTANGRKDGDKVMECSERSSGIILIKSFTEIEAKFIDYFSVLMKKKVVPIEYQAAREGDLVVWGIKR